MSLEERWFLEARSKVRICFLICSKRAGLTPQGLKSPKDRSIISGLNGDEFSSRIFISREVDRFMVLAGVYLNVHVIF